MIDDSLMLKFNVESIPLVLLYGWILRCANQHIVGLLSFTLYPLCSFVRYIGSMQCFCKSVEEVYESSLTELNVHKRRIMHYGCDIDMQNFRPNAWI